MGTILDELYPGLPKQTNNYTDYPDLNNWTRQDTLQVVVIPAEGRHVFIEFCQMLHEDCRCYTELVQDDKAPMPRAKAFEATALYEDYGIKTVDPTVVVWFFNQHDTLEIYHRLYLSNWFIRESAKCNSDTMTDEEIDEIETFIRDVWRAPYDEEPNERQERDELRKKYSTMSHRERVDEFFERFTVNPETWGKMPDEF